MSTIKNWEKHFEWLTTPDEPALHIRTWQQVVEHHNEKQVAVTSWADLHRQIREMTQHGRCKQTLSTSF